ncbi:MAG: hypothetical protein HC894_08790 [Microcoleus sp. SM1_3_4]|nr:hypothetical protein [Microcoleus sp. SM1_3_4]
MTTIRDTFWASKGAGIVKFGLGDAVGVGLSEVGDGVGDAVGTTGGVASCATITE